MGKPTGGNSDAQALMAALPEMLRLQVEPDALSAESGIRTPSIDNSAVFLGRNMLTK
jgi:hypothetical protein